MVSDPNAVISAQSKMVGLGKTPSRFNAAGEVVGIPKWTAHTSTARDVGRWLCDSRLGICLQSRAVKGFDIDIGDPLRALAVANIIELTLGQLPVRGRANSGKRLLAFRLPVDFPKRIIKTEHGNIELLSTGQQFVVCGTHPSGARYDWGNGQGAPVEIPELTMAEVDATWAALITMFALPDGASEVRNGMVPTVPRMAEDLKDATVAWLDENGWVTGYQRDGRVDVRCPWEDGHSTDSGPTSTSWFPAGVGGFAMGHFRCLHASCSTRTDGDFLETTGYTASDFGPIFLNEEQVAEAAASAIHNAKQLPAIALETQRDRAARIGREGEHTTPRQRVMTGTEMLEELVFIADGSRVSFVAEPRFVLPVEEFKRFTAGSVEVAKSPSGRAAKVHAPPCGWNHKTARRCDARPLHQAGRPYASLPTTCRRKTFGRRAQLWRQRTGASCPPHFLSMSRIWCRTHLNATASSTGWLTSSKTPALYPARTICWWPGKQASGATGLPTRWPVYLQATPRWALTWAGLCARDSTGP